MTTLHLQACTRLLAVLVIFLCVELNNAESQNPVMRTNCCSDDDPFISSESFGGKFFLHPWKTDERRGDWYYNRAYCAHHCAEMVTINSTAENEFFHEFMRSVGMVHPGAWLGAQIRNKRDICKWSNGLEMTFCPKAPGEFNEEGLTCLDVGWDNDRVWWRNFYCTGAASQLHFIACQRLEISILARASIPPCPLRGHRCPIFEK